MDAVKEAVRTVVANAWDGPALYHGSTQRFEKGTVLTPEARHPEGSIHSGDWVYATTSPESARYFASQHDSSPETDSPVHIHRVVPVGDVEPDHFPIGAEDSRFAKGNYRAKALRVVDHHQVPSHYDTPDPVKQAVLMMLAAKAGWIVNEPGGDGPELHHERGGDWYHGTKHRFADFGHDERPDLFADKEYGDNSHWNGALGSHWTSEKGVARQFARGVYQHAYTNHGKEGQIHTAHLGITNPKHYENESDMDREALHGAWDSHEAHDPEQIHDSHCDGECEGEGLSGHAPGSETDNKVKAEYLKHPGYAARWISSHPERDDIADSFKRNLTEEGHDGVTYGNEGEGPKGHLCAIAFDHNQIKHHHVVDQSKFAGRVARQDPPEGLTFSHIDTQTGGSRHPVVRALRAEHPQHGLMGQVDYYLPKRANGPVTIDSLHVEPDVRRLGVGSALMDEVQRRHPDSRVVHSDRTDDGKAWWADYSAGKPVRRGRTAAGSVEPMVRFYTEDEVRAGVHGTVCPCCGGTGEHPCGHECYACDGGVGEGAVDADWGPPCEGHMDRPAKSEIDENGSDYGARPENWMQHQGAFKPPVDWAENHGGTEYKDSHWHRGGCMTYAHALMRAKPGLRFGTMGHTEHEGADVYDVAQHHFAHDDTHAYDSKGKHPLPYKPAGMDFSHTDDDPDDYDEPDEEDIPVAQEHAKANHILDGHTAARMAPPHALHVLDPWQPTERLFAPTKGNVDPRLFDDNREMKPGVRGAILAITQAFFERHGWGGDTRGWARVYLAGSQASEWYGNNDFDILVGVRYDTVKIMHPQFMSKTNREITNEINLAFRQDFNNEQWHPPFDPEAEWHLTGYVNMDSWDIRQIKPYAAYNVTDGVWAVDPIDEPIGHQFSSSEWYYFEGIAQQVRHALALPEPRRSTTCTQIWSFIHSDRSRAFGPNGTGAFDRGNALEKYLDQAGLMEPLQKARFGSQVTAARKMLPNSEIPNLRFDDHPGASIDVVRAKLKRKTPDYYQALHDDIAANGVQNPVLLRKTPRGKVSHVMDGTHRAVIAHELGQDIPVGDYDNEKDYDSAYAGPGARAWANKRWDLDARRAARTAGARGDLPEGMTFRHGGPGELPDDGLFRPASSGEHEVRASVGDKTIGQIKWLTHPNSPAGWKPGHVLRVGVHPDYHRRGVATELLRRAREVEPRVHHSQQLTDDGAAWAEKTAGINGDLPSLHFQHHDANETGEVNSHLEAWHPHEAGPDWSEAPPHVRNVWAGSHVDPGHRPVASISWDHGTGKIMGVYTVDEHKRKGIASELLRRARQIDPRVHHSEDLTDSGQAWSSKVAANSGLPWYAHATDAEIDAHHNPSMIREHIGKHMSPQGHNYRLVQHSGNLVSAHYMGKGESQIKNPQHVGSLSWFGGHRDDDPNDDSSMAKGRIWKAAVKPGHQRRGVASAMLDFAREKNPDDNIRHSTVLTDDAKAWAEKKAALKPVEVAGLCLKAENTGRVLMIQRSNKDKKDPARGTWEFPGGHLDKKLRKDGGGYETPLEGAQREFCEETGAEVPPKARLAGNWVNGIYQGFVMVVKKETDLELNLDHEDRGALNPDDPDGDDIEVCAWFEVDHLPKMPALREEVRKTPWEILEKACWDITADPVKRKVAQIVYLQTLDTGLITKDSWGHGTEQRTADRRGPLPRGDRSPDPRRLRAGGRAAQPHERRLGAGDPRGDAGQPRPLSYHPQASKEIGKLDKPTRAKALSTLSRLSQGDPNVQTHALTNLKGWLSTKVDSHYRIIHQSTPEGGIHVGYVGHHDYDRALRRLTMRMLGQEAEDWRMSHRPPGREGIPFHDLTHNLPEDVYTHPHYYDPTGGDPETKHTFDETMGHLQRARGNPDAKVRVFRSLPPEHVHKGIGPGDWVTTSKDYAMQHGRHATDPKKDWPVIRTTVRAGDLHSDGDDLREWGYNGEKTHGGMVSFKGGHDSEVSMKADGTISPVQRRGPSAIKGFSMVHDHYDRGVEGTHGGVSAYDPKGDYAGHMRWDSSGVYSHHIEPQHEAIAEHLDKKMRSYVPAHIPGTVTF